MKKITYDQREAKVERAEELAKAECELSRLADFFDMERKLNAAMDAGRCQYDFGQHEYTSRDDAFDDWFSHQLSTEEDGCAAAAYDALTSSKHWTIFVVVRLLGI